MVFVLSGSTWAYIRSAKSALLEHLSDGGVELIFGKVT